VDAGVAVTIGSVPRTLHVRGTPMDTKLNKQLKREIDGDGKPFYVTLSQRD